MNIEVNALQPRSESRPIVDKTPTQTLYWSIRRELWENRSIYIAPLIAAGVMLFGFILSTFGLPHRRRALLLLDPAQQRAHIERPYDMLAMALIVTAFIVGVFYCLDALHGERRDRSILFWKSLPVSDSTTVLSKACIPLVVLPLLVFAIAVVAQVDMMLLSSAILMANDAASGDAGSAAAGSKLGDAALRADRDGALALADLRVVAPRLRLGAPRDFPLGGVPAARGVGPREDGVGHDALHGHAAVPHGGRHVGGVRLPAAARLTWAHDSPHADQSGEISDTAGSLDRSRIRRGFPGRRRAAPPLPGTDLTRGPSYFTSRLRRTK